MRPVTKKNVGETIVVQDGTEQTILNDYRKHRESFPALVANLGQYFRIASVIVLVIQICK